MNFHLTYCPQYVFTLINMADGILLHNGLLKKASGVLIVANIYARLDSHFVVSFLPFLPKESSSNKWCLMQINYGLHNLRLQWWFWFWPEIKCDSTILHKAEQILGLLFSTSAFMVCIWLQ